MQIRKHRGLYSESMETEKTIEPTVAAIVEYFKDDIPVYLDLSQEVEVKFYCDTPGRFWKQDYIITCSIGVLGFCSEPVSN